MRAWLGDIAELKCQWSEEDAKAGKAYPWLAAGGLPGATGDWSHMPAPGTVTIVNTTNWRFKGVGMSGVHSMELVVLCSASRMMDTNRWWAERVVGHCREAVV